jgi:carbon starvation protein
MSADMLLANLFYETATSPDGTPLKQLHAMPIMIAALAILAIAYRYYSAFLAAKVAAFDDRRVTPAHEFNDGQNYHPTNRCVLFGHHFAAISGAGPLIGPVLAMQYGFAPGLLWLLVGVCLAGAVQDMLVMAASVRRGGKSLAEIARHELGKPAALVASLAILFIVIIALAGLAFVVVKALGGEEAKLPRGMQIELPAGEEIQALPKENGATATVYQFPAGCSIRYSAATPASRRSEAFRIAVPEDAQLDRLWPAFFEPGGGAVYLSRDGKAGEYVESKTQETGNSLIRLPAGCKQIIPGSSWGTFTIFCTIPIALFVGLWMYRIRPGRVVEASIIGGVLVLGAVVAGAWIPGSPLESVFGLSREHTIIALCVYGFIAAVLPVWLLLTPRDYLSSFMKIGTLALLIVGVVLANPTLKHPPINETWRLGGPTFPGGLFPFVFICVMCGAISGFHALVASGTTPKMIDKERDIRTIGYGAMLMEGLVGIVALIAAAAMPMDLYYPINVDVEKEPVFQKRTQEMYQKYGTTPEARQAERLPGVRDVHQLDLAKMEESVGGESLRGRTGGAVTLAVSMAMIFTDAFSWADDQLHRLMKYWYHFAIMFEALFILTTIDAGTRIARYLFQETLGKLHRNFARQDWLPGALLATALVTAGWGILVHTGQINTIWPMFGIANQLLAVMALAIVTTLLVNSGKGRYAPVTLLPMLFVTSTTLMAGKIMIGNQLDAMRAGKDVTINVLNMGLTIFVIASVCTLLLIAAARWLSVWLAQKNRS